ncbi:hypothetical protein CsSME_00048666 [Camellia sinensis var. sinensis]
MDANGKASKSGEIGRTENNYKSSPTHPGAEVVLVISGHASTTSNGVDSAQPSPEIARFSPSPNKPPKIPTTETLTRRKSLSRSVFSKPKSRFGEQSVPIDSNLLQEITSVMQQRSEQTVFSPNTNLSSRESPTNKMAPTTSTLKER